MLIDINEIVVSDRIRIRRDCGDVDDLAKSIKAIGLLSPIIVDERFRVIDGERRLMACKQIGWNVMDVHMVKVRDADDFTKRELGILEPSAKWTPKAIRKILPRHGSKDRKPCFICGDHKSITEAHQLVQLSELAGLLNRGAIGVGDVKSTIAWLCPNCHAYVHAAMRGDADAVLDVYMSPKWREGYEELSRRRIDAISKMIEGGAWSSLNYDALEAARRRRAS